MAKKQLGSILLKPSEAGHAAEIASRGGSSTIVNTSSGRSTLSGISGYGGSGGGSSGGGLTFAQKKALAAQKAAEAEAERQRVAAEKLKNAKQKAVLLKQIESVKQARIESAKIKTLSAKQKKAYFQSIANQSRAITLQTQKQVGKRLTPTAQKFVDKYLPTLRPSQQGSNFEELVAKKQNELKNKKENKSFIKKVNEFGSGIQGRQTTLQYNDLIRERDSIYADLEQLNQQYKGSLENNYAPGLKRYQNELVPIIARFNNYNAAKEKVLKKFPEKKKEATVEYNPSLNSNVLVLSKKDSSLSNKINKAIDKSLTNVARGGGGETLKLSALVAAGVGVGAVKGFAQLPSTIKTVVKNPSVLKKLPSAIKKSGKDFGYLLSASPTAAFVKIGANVFVIKGTNAVLKRLGRLSSRAFAELNPKYVGRLKSGRIFKIKTGKGKFARVKVVGKIPKATIKSQVELAGKKVTAISTQADALLGVLKRSRKISKPLGKNVEKTIGKKAVSLLKKYDKGIKLSRKEISFLDKSIKKAGSKGLLERSFFADPYSRLRPSRLGISKEKKFKLIDYLTEDITFKKSKPQILLFEDIKVQSFPKSLKHIAKKLKSKKTLTESEVNKLLQFQLKKSGKFKPVGFVSKESEITLPQGEIIKKVKKVGLTRIKGKNVPIVKAEIYKPKISTKKLISKFKKGGITNKELKKLDRILKKETGFDYNLSSYKKSPRRYVSIKRIGTSSLLTRKSLKKKRRTTSKLKKDSYKKSVSSYPKSKIKYTSSGKPYVITSSGARFLSSKKPSSFIKSPIRKTPSSPRIRTNIPKRQKEIPARKSKKVRVARKKPKGKTGYDVYARPLKRKGQKKKPKLVKVNRVPLTKRRAEDLRNYISDTSLARTSELKKTNKKPQKPQLKIPLNYAKTTNKKFRNFRQVKGKRKPLTKGRVIERGRFLLDTRYEKKRISLARRIKQLQKQGKRKKVRVKSNSVKRTTNKKINRTQMLKNLAKARRVRMANLRKKKR